MFQKQKKAFAGIKAGISSQRDMPLLVKELVQTARKLKLSVAAVSYDIPLPGRRGAHHALLFLSAEGATRAVKRFIYEIETSDRLVGIRTSNWMGTGESKAPVEARDVYQGQ